MIWTVVKWILKLLIGFAMIAVHWSLFVLFIALLMFRTWWKQRRIEQTRLSEEQTEEGVLYREFDLYEPEGQNADGSDRREIYNKCYRGDEVILKYNPAPDNVNRLEVWTRFGQIGLIAPFFVEQYASTFKSGTDVHGRIKKITSGANAACVLEIAFPDNGDTVLNGE